MCVGFCVLPGHLINCGLSRRQDGPEANIKQRLHLMVSTMFGGVGQLGGWATVWSDVHFGRLEVSLMFNLDIQIEQGRIGKDAW